MYGKYGLAQNQKFYFSASEEIYEFVKKNFPFYGFKNIGAEKMQKEIAAVQKFDDCKKNLQSFYVFL